MNTFLFRAALAAVFVSAAACSFASVTFSTLGPHGEYDTESGETISGVATTQTGFINDWGCDEFTASTTGTVNRIRVVTQIIAGFNSFSVTLHEDNVDHLWTALGTWKVNNQPVYGSGADPTTIDIAGGPTLTAGTKYWIEVNAGDTGRNTFGIWNDSSQDQTGLIGFGSGGHLFYVDDRPLHAFEVNVAAVPEPIPLVGFSLGSLVVLRRRRVSRMF